MPNERARELKVITPRAWKPLVFVGVVLLLLLGMPVAVMNRIRALRQNRIDAADEARLLVHDYEASFALELLAVDASRANAAWSDSASASAITTERADERALDSMVTRAGPEGTERLVILRQADARWRETHPPAGGPAPDRAIDGNSARGRDVLSSADSLSQYLLDISTTAREEVHRLERVDVYSAAGLTPIALVALAIVFGLERRMRAFAGEAADRAEKLERSVELRATLIHGVVHDIRNPLGAAAGFVELLTDGLAGALNEQQAEMVTRVKRLLATAGRTVDEVVDLARVDAGEYPINRSTTDVVAAVREVVDDYQARAAQQSLALTFQPERDSMVAATDSARLRHIVENLLSNAIKYTPKGGAISVEVAAQRTVVGHPRIAVTVRDNGLGINPEFRERIFDPFFRVPSTERTVAGGGLGLALSRRMARLLGGDLTVSDAPEHGSVFVVTLPAAEAPA